jgi:hypothetical protein
MDIVHFFIRSIPIYRKILFSPNLRSKIKSHPLISKCLPSTSPSPSPRQTHSRSAAQLPPCTHWPLSRRPWLPRALSRSALSLLPRPRPPSRRPLVAFRLSVTLPSTPHSRTSARRSLSSLTTPLSSSARSSTRRPPPHS